MLRTDRLYHDFIHLLFLHAHREAAALATEIPVSSSSSRMVPADILFMTTSGLLYHDFIHLFFVYVHREVDDVDRKIPLRISRIHSHTLGCSGVEITLPPPNMFISHVVYYAETR